MTDDVVDELNIGSSDDRNLDEDEQLSKFKLQISKDADVVAEQRDQANEDMRYSNVPGGMWEGGFFEETGVNNFNSRAKPQLDITGQYTDRFIGQWNQNRVGVEFKPDDANTSDQDSDLMNGIYRADFRQFSGKIATDHAVDEVVTCGYGAFKLAAVFDDDGDPENDLQHLEWRPLYEAYNTVIWDQAAQRIDKRDARHVNVLKQYTRDEFLEAFDDKDPVTAYSPTNRAFENWNNGQTEIVYVSTRYHIEKEDETAFVYNNFESGKVEVYFEDDHELIKNDLRRDNARSFVRKRVMKRQTVWKTVYSGAEILIPSQRIAGKWIPIVPMFGFRTYVDGVEYYRGLVRKLKDAGRLYNMYVAQLAEYSASNGQEVPIVTPDQMNSLGIIDQWANKSDAPILFLDPVYDAEGNIAHLGPIGYSKPGQLDGATIGLAENVLQFVQAMTGGAPQDTLDPDASGKAINALLKRENMVTQQVSDNIANAITWSGEVYQSMAAEVYSTPRIMRTLGRDGTEGQQQLFKTVLDDETGMLTQANALRGKRFRVFADVGPQYDTLREQTVEDMKGILEILIQVQDPEVQRFIPVIIMTMLDNTAGVGLKPLRDLTHRMMLEKGLIQPESEEDEAIVAQVQQQAQQPDPNEQLLEAAAQQQQAEARSLDSSSVQKIADARKKEAETAEILAGIEQKDQQLAQEARRDTLKFLESLPVEGDAAN